MTEPDTDLADAAALHAACRRIVAAVGELAARPLDEQAAHRMRLALEQAHSPQMRQIVARLAAPRRTGPELRVVGSARDHTPRVCPQPSPSAVTLIGMPA